MREPRLSRRRFLASATLLVGALGLRLRGAGTDETIIDIHQHTHFQGRSDDELVAHQRAMGVSLTILHPAGSNCNRPSTNGGRGNGLAALCGGNESVQAVASKYPGEFVFCANEVPDLPDARRELERHLRRGGVGIGEQKFHLDLDSPAMDTLAGIAREHSAPILLHIEDGNYYSGFERFHRTLEKYPGVNFIGHSETWWANIDLRHDRSKGSGYPQGPVTPGGITDRLLADYPNIYGDLSAGSGLNALRRDEAQASAFIARHHSKLLFGSDCADRVGHGTVCTGAQIIAAIRRLSPSAVVERALLCENARKLFRLT